MFGMVAIDVKKFGMSWFVGGFCSSWILCARSCIYSFIFPAGDRFSNFTRLD